MAMKSNLYDLLRGGFAARMDQTCLQTRQGKTWSYREIDQSSARYAAALRGLGLTAGDRLVAQVDKSVDAVLLYLACLRCGIIYVPLNTAYTTHEIEYFLSDANPHTLICRPEDLQRLASIAQEQGAVNCLSLADGLDQYATKAAADEQLTRLDQDAVIAMIYTSGTTGRSKGAMLSYENLASNLLALHEIWGWQSDDVLLHALPIFHVHGLFVALHCALLGGSTVLFHEKFDIDALREDLPRARVLMGVPTFYTRLLKCADFMQDDCRNMRLFISGSAPLPADTFEEFFLRSGHNILERYGMTEAGMITSNPLKGERRAGTVGYALPKVSLRIRDADGRELPASTVGNLEIRGPNVFMGYWNKPAKTAEEFCDDGYFRTGDLGQLDPDGRLTLVGRAKDLIISGGYNIYPKEIESVLDALPAVLESAVIGLPDADLGEMVVAIVVPANGASLDQQVIYSALRKQLARFKQPRHIVSINSLPRNAMGKVQKQQLREQYGHELC